MNNVGVIRMEVANQMKQQNPQEAEMKINSSFDAFDIALKSVNCRLQTKESDDVEMEVEEQTGFSSRQCTNKYKALRLTILFNQACLHE